jgi:hypothetical protein
VRSIEYPFSRRDLRAARALAAGRPLTVLAAAALLVLAGGCAQPTAPVAAGAAPMARVPGTGTPAAPAAPGRDVPLVKLAPPASARDWDQFKLQAARRLVEANPKGTYMSPVSDPLLAIPVLEIELHRDGSVRQIQVIRQPSQALDTVQLAIAAVHRAAPFGDMSHLSRPWKFVEVFLFDEDRLFKPRTLDD